MSKLAFSIDENELLLKAMISGKDGSLIYKEYPIASEHIANEICYAQIFKVFDTLIANDLRHASATYVLPNKYVICDYIELPTSCKKKNALYLELSSRYKNHDDFLTHFVKSGKDESGCHYFVFLINKKHLYSIHSALKNCKFSSCFITFEAAATANAFLSLNKFNYSEPSMLIDIKKTDAKIMLIKNELNGFADLSLPTNEIESFGFIFGQMRNAFASNYHMKNLKLVINSNSPISINTDNTEHLVIDNTLITDHLDLYGALNSKNKGPKLNAQI